MTETYSDLPKVAKQELKYILEDKRVWNFKKGVLLGPNMSTIQMRFDNIMEYRWQEEVFFPLYFRMLDLLCAVKSNDKEWIENHVHVAKHKNGEEQKYFECLGESDCDYILNERLELIQYRYRLAHADLWEPVIVTKEIVESYGFMPAGQLQMTF
jgi:hypothetical protein